jgi:hypothetical protein
MAKVLADNKHGSTIIQKNQHVLRHVSLSIWSWFAHVGHPLGYIASDVYSRYKRHQGYNVCIPWGYDSFGLPAEQYAIQTGQRPEDDSNIDGGFDKEGNKIAGYRNNLTNRIFIRLGEKYVLQILIITNIHNGFLSIVQLLV